jgi:hypothetical protein
MELWEIVDAVVDVEEDLENVPLALVEIDVPDRFDDLEFDRWRDMASNDAFFV